MTTINAEISIDRDDRPVAKLFAETDETKVGQVGRTIFVTFGQNLDPILVTIQVEIHPQQSFAYERHHRRDGTAMKRGFGQDRLASDQGSIDLPSQANRPTMMGISAIQERDDKPRIRDPLHERMKPLRRERFLGPSMLPAKARKGLEAPSRRTRSKASLTRLPWERPVAFAFSSTHRARASGRRTLNVVLIWRICNTHRKMSNTVLKAPHRSIRGARRL